MHTYDDLLELARICAKNAYVTRSKEVAAELWSMAREYQKKAAIFTGGRLPDIGKPPPFVAE